MIINCIFWSPINSKNRGACSLGYRNGYPSFTFCKNCMKNNLNNVKAVEESKPPITFKDVKNFATAKLIGRRVSLEIFNERIETCRKCNMQRVDKNGIPFCGVCRCQNSSNNNALENLATYEENLPKWGCKHPLRTHGQGWKR